MAIFTAEFFSARSITKSGQKMSKKNHKSSIFAGIRIFLFRKTAFLMVKIAERPKFLTVCFARKENKERKRKQEKEQCNNK